MTDLHETLLDRLGPSYDMMYVSTCDFLGVSLDADPAFVDRFLGDELQLADHPPENEE